MKNLILLLSLVFTMLAYGQTEREIKTGIVNLKQQGSAPSSPASGSFKTYVRDGKLRMKTSAGVESTIGSALAGDSGVNLLANNSFEDGVATGWTSSGGTLTSQSYSNTSDGELKFARFVATTSNQYVESTAYAIPDFLTGGCIAYSKYLTATSSGFNIQVYDGSSNLLGQSALVFTNSQWLTTPYIAFQCPSVGTTVKVRFNSNSAATIDLDKAYLGSENRTSNVQQARAAFEAFFAATTNCSWSRTNTSIGNVNQDADCPGPTVLYSNVGSAQTTNLQRPSITVNAVPAGSFYVTFSAVVTGSASGSHCLSINDGTTTGTSKCVNAFTAPVYVEVNHLFTYTTASARTYTLGASASTGTITLANDAPQIKVTGVYYPNDTQVAVNSDQSSWFIDANIGGANPSLGTADVTSYTGIEDSGLDMVLNTGSANAEIGCSSTNAPSGLTCAAGNESISVAWTPPYTGWFDVCFDFAHAATAAASGVIDTVFQVVETATNAQTVTAEGGSRLESNVNVVSSLAFPYRLCGSFYASSINKKLHRLMFEQDTTATVTSNTISADRSATLGQRDIRVTVRPSIMNIARPVLDNTKMYMRYSSNNGQAADTGVIEFEDLEEDTTNGAYSTSTGLFTAPRAMRVQVCFGLKTANAVGAVADIWSAFIRRGNTEIFGGSHTVQTTTSSAKAANACGEMNLAAGQTTSVRVSEGIAAALTLSANSQDNYITIREL